MTRMTGPDCAVMCNLINTHTHTHIYTHTHTEYELECRNGIVLILRRDTQRSFGIARRSSHPKIGASISLMQMASSKKQ